jgi:hypothetical protein
VGQRYHQWTNFIDLEQPARHSADQRSRSTAEWRAGVQAARERVQRQSAARVALQPAGGGDGVRDRPPG